MRRFTRKIRTRNNSVFGHLSCSVLANFENTMHHKKLRSIGFTFDEQDSFNREHVLRRSFIGVSIRQILLLAMTLAVTHKLNTAWKVSKYGVFSCPYFSIFGLNTEIYSLNLRIQSKYGPEKLNKTAWNE